jgi:hypothetical protein
MRIVLDTSVVVGGLRTRLGAGNAVLRLVARKPQASRQSMRLHARRQDRRCRHQGGHRTQDRLRFQVAFGHDQTALIGERQIVKQ